MNQEKNKRSRMAERGKKKNNFFFRDPIRFQCVWSEALWYYFSVGSAVEREGTQSADTVPGGTALGGTAPQAMAAMCPALARSSKQGLTGVP